MTDILLIIIVILLVGIYSLLVKVLNGFGTEIQKNEDDKWMNSTLYPVISLGELEYRRRKNDSWYQKIKTAQEKVDVLIETVQVDKPDTYSEEYIAAKKELIEAQLHGSKSLRIYKEMIERNLLAIQGKIKITDPSAGVTETYDALGQKEIDKHYQETIQFDIKAKR